MILDTEKNDLRRLLPLELSRRLEGVSPQFGKTVFMKLAYLLQELYQVPLGYRFTLYTYGPYSPEVLADLEFAELRREVKVDYLGKTGGFSITPGEDAKGVGERRNEAIDKHGEALDKLVEYFGKFNARDLELRTTSVFLWKSLRPTNPSHIDSLIQTVRNLKPHFDESTIRSAIDGLISCEVIGFYPAQHEDQEAVPGSL